MISVFRHGFRHLRWRSCRRNIRRLKNLQSIHRHRNNRRCFCSCCYRSSCCSWKCCRNSCLWKRTNLSSRRRSWRNCCGNSRWMKTCRKERKNSWMKNRYMNR